MGKVTVNIDTDNDAFGNNSDSIKREVARILEEAGSSFHIDESDSLTKRKLYDINGNWVGDITYQDD